jgi:uncharacterized protein (DUF58 family)
MSADIPSAGHLLLPEATRRRLEGVQLAVRVARAGTIKGERRSTRRGTSLEFADYRHYVAGDDLRRMDWNIYARSEKPTIRLLEDEEDLAVHLVLDTSASMAWGAPDAPPPAAKMQFARRLFAALAYVALASNDRLLMTGASDRGLVHFGPARGRAQAVAMLRFVHDLQTGGITDLNRVLRELAMRTRRPGLAILISDMFSPTGYAEGLAALTGRGFETVFVHVLAPEEVTPPLGGDLRLVDVESGHTREVTIDGPMRAWYERRLAAWQGEMRAYLGRRQAHYVFCTTDEAPERVILRDLRRLGVVR